MAGGWAKDGAVQEQIDASVEDAVKRAREALNAGTGSTDCEDCGEQIPAARRKALPTATRCVGCQEISDRENKSSSTFNRRGSKDSQLR